MKKAAFLFLLIGLLVGFTIGSVARYKPQQSSPVNDAAPNQLAESKSARPNHFNEKELLLQAIQELDLTTTELEDARNYIKKLERNTHRYNWLMDYWKEKGFGTSYQMSISMHQQFRPSDDLIAFFGWTEEQVAEMTRIGKNAAEAIKEWEGQQAFCVEDSEKRQVYEIPAMPREIAEQYLQSMGDIIDPEDMELLSSKFELQFEGQLQDRIVTMTIGPKDNDFFPGANPGQQEYVTIVSKPKNNGSLPYSQAGRTTSIMPYLPGKAIPHRWGHVIKNEGEVMPDYDFPDEGWIKMETGSQTGGGVKAGD